MYRLSPHPFKIAMSQNLKKKKKKGMSPNDCEKLMEKRTPWEIAHIQVDFVREFIINEGLKKVSSSPAT